MNMRIVFMGSPEFAIPSLKSLAEGFQVVGVVTQPDRPAGRGRLLTPPPIKNLAQKMGLPVIQPKRLSEPQAMEQLEEWEPELIVVAAFGQILRQEVLDLPAHGCINVHASLLPRWRGAAPIQAAILNGDKETGVTIMRMDAGVDTGDILGQKAIPIGEKDTAGSLGEKLSHLGAELLVETLPSYLNGKLTPKPQDEDTATYAPMLSKEDGQLDFNLPAPDLARRVRAFNPWPGAFTYWKGQPLKVLAVQAIDEEMPKARSGSLLPGTRLVYHGLPGITASNGLLLLGEVQPAGKKPMSGQDFLRGARDWPEV